MDFFTCLRYFRRGFFRVEIRSYYLFTRTMEAFLTRNQSPLRPSGQYAKATSSRSLPGISDEYKKLLARVMGLKDMTEPADYSIIRRRFTAGVCTCKVTHGAVIAKGFFNRGSKRLNQGI